MGAVGVAGDVGPAVGVLLVAGVCALAAPSVRADPIPFACPARLEATRQQTEEVPAGFTATQQSAQHVLDAFRINEGPLEMRAGAIYDSVKTQTDAKGTVTERLVWLVPKTPGSLAICGYSFTSVVLTRPLDGYKECTAINRKVKGGVFELVNAECH